MIKNGLPCTPYQLVNDRKASVRQYRVFGCPAIFKRYEINDNGKRIKNKSKKKMRDFNKY